MNNNNLNIDNWCPYVKYNPSSPDYLKGDYTTIEDGNIPHAFRSSGPNKGMTSSAVHGGLFNAPVTNNPWNAIPVTPTMTNYIQNNLRSANPPPGATEQYIGTPRLGNNYAPMPAVYWYNPVGEQQGKYRMKVTHECDKRSFDESGLSVQPNTNDDYTYTSELLNNNATANIV